MKAPVHEVRRGKRKWSETGTRVRNIAVLPVLLLSPRWGIRKRTESHPSHRTAERESPYREREVGDLQYSQRRVTSSRRFALDSKAWLRHKDDDNDEVRGRKRPAKHHPAFDASHYGNATAHVS